MRIKSENSQAKLEACLPIRYFPRIRVRQKWEQLKGARCSTKLTCIWAQIFASLYLTMIPFCEFKRTLCCTLNSYSVSSHSCNWRWKAQKRTMQGNYCLVLLSYVSPSVLLTLWDTLLWCLAHCMSISCPSSATRWNRKVKFPQK